MTNELEKQFFNTFGIEPKSLFICKRGYYPEVCTQPTCKGCNEAIEHGKYPQITDRILLELICILSSNPIRILFESMLSGIKEVELLKNSILLACIANKDTIKHQVRTLFEEG